jgi:hypothetical protein
VVNGVLLRSLPFKDSERLVMVWNRGPAGAGGDRTPLAVADLLDWRAQNKSFVEIGAFETTSYNLTGGELPEQIRAAQVTANFFSVLGVQPQLGRTFLPGEDRAGSEVHAANVPLADSAPGFQRPALPSFQAPQLVAQGSPVKAFPP